MDDAVQTVMTQCELWTDNNDMHRYDENIVPFEQSKKYDFSQAEAAKVAEEEHFSRKKQ